LDHIFPEEAEHLTLDNVELFLCPEIDQVRPAQMLFVLRKKPLPVLVARTLGAFFRRHLPHVQHASKHQEANLLYHSQRVGDATGPELQPELIDLAFQRTGNHMATAPPLPSRLESALCIRRQGPYLPHCPRQSCQYEGQPSSHETHGGLCASARRWDRGGTA